MKTATVLRVTLGALAFWLWSAIYFTVLAKPWAAAVGKSQAELQSGGFVPYVLALVCAWLLAYGIDVVIAYGTPVTWQRGATVGCFLAVTIYGSSVAAMGGFEVRPGILTAIDSGWVVIGAIVVGALLGAMQEQHAAKTAKSG